MSEVLATCVECFGTRIGIAYPAHLDSAIRPRLPPGARIHPPDRELPTLSLASGVSYLVDFDNERLVETELLEVALQVFESRLRLHVAEQAPGLIFVHAGCATVDNVAVVVPGRSFSGKSTLTAALLAAGATYYSDEYAVLDREGLVNPYARTVSLRPGGRRNQLEVPPEELGAAVGDGPCRVGIVALTSYEPGATWRPVKRSAGTGALGLLRHAIPARARPEETLEAVRAAVHDSLTLEGPRGEAEEAALDLIARARALAA